MPSMAEFSKIKPPEPKSDEKVEVEKVSPENSILVPVTEIENLEKAPSVLSDSEGDESDENFLPFKKYTGTTCKKKSNQRYKQKLKLIKPIHNENSEEEVKF